MQEISGSSDWALLPSQKKALNLSEIEGENSDDEDGEIGGSGNVDVVSKSIESILRTSRSPFTKSATLPPKILGKKETEREMKQRKREKERDRER